MPRALGRVARDSPTTIPRPARSRTRVVCWGARPWVVAGPLGCARARPLALSRQVRRATDVDPKTLSGGQSMSGTEILRGSMHVAYKVGCRVLCDFGGAGGWVAQRTVVCRCGTSGCTLSLTRAVRPPPRNRTENGLFAHHAQPHTRPAGACGSVVVCGPRSRLRASV
jgi:hypothetical protein